MASEVSICNQAIGWLGGNPITSFTDNTVEAQLCGINYPLLRDAVLEEGKWTFATKRIKLLPSAQAPAQGYSHRFEVPSTVMTVIRCTQYADDKEFKQDLDWRLEEEFILTNVDELYAKCIVNVTDVKKFTNTFNQALAARIAADLAAPLTESTTKETRMWEKYYRNLDIALGIDGMQGRSDILRTRSRIVQGR